MLNPLVPPSSVSTSATPAAAGELFIGRLLTVLVALDGLISEHGPSRGRVHGLRVAARRAEAALAGFASALDEMPALKVRRMLKRLRRSAGRARDADVALPRLQQHCEAASGKALKAAERVLESARDERREAYAELTVMAREFPRRRFERLIHRLTERSAVMALEPKVAARQAIHDAVVDARAQAAQGLTGDETLHRLRLKLKRLRYVVELFALVLPADPVEAVLVRLREASDALGAVSDGMAMRLRLQAQKGRGGLAALLTTHNRHQRNARARAVQVWRRLERDAVLDSLEEVVLDAPADRAPAPTASVPQVPIEPVGESAGAVRLAAIDMGTNSIRLIVAEALRDGTYRILDDEKEVARLGRGLEHTGRMDERAMEQAAFAVARMKRIAEGFGVRAVRAVATSAAREAANGSELIKMVRRWAGLEVRVISAEEEAQLAFESVARAFDLSALCAAVVDIGGGSTQITLTRGGIAERVWTLPIGAVRLTERFGGAAACSGGRWREMLKWLGGEWAEAMSASSANAKSEIEPQLIIGTGGTMTALGNIALAEETAGPDHSRGSGAAHGSGPPVGALQGYELKVGEIKRIVGSLRGMTLEERARVPGLSADRADIIVAGGAIALAVIKQLGVRRVRIHNGGIRDGLLLRLVRELYPAAQASPNSGATDPLFSARRFAEACRCDVAHGEQVAKLATRIFDQLAARAAASAKRQAPWANAESRRLLAAAALVLDVGYVVNYDKHHLHSFNLILQSAMVGFSSREVSIIAHLARYHRAAAPKADHDSFAALAKRDQETVRRLAGIVRIAVGLDRTHVQAVKDLGLVFENDSVRFVATAAENPTVDLWGASRKSGLFSEVFGLRAEFHWQPTGHGPRVELPTRRSAAGRRSLSKPEAILAR